MGAGDGDAAAGGKPRRPRAPRKGGPAGRGADRPRPAADAAAPAQRRAAPAAKAPEPAPAKRTRGFLHAAALAAKPIREASARRGFAEARVLTEWDSIVGETLAGACRPLRLSHSEKGFGGTLMVLAEGPRAPEVEMLGPRIVERVNAHYGYRAVTRVKVVQTDRGMTAARRAAAGTAGAAAGMAEPSRGFDRAGAPKGGDGPVSGAVDSEAEARVGAATAGVESPALRAALERLGRHVLGRAPAFKGKGRTE